MAVVVEQTIPFQTKDLDAENPTRWNTLFPLIRPSIKAVKTSSGQTVLVDQALANDRHVRVAAIGRTGNFSSKLLSDKHITAAVTESRKGTISAEEVVKAINVAGHSKSPGTVIVRSGKQRRIEAARDDVLEVEVEGDLEVDHVIHLLGATTEQTRSSITKVSECLKIFVKTAATASSTFHVEKAEANPAILHAEGSSSGYEEAKEAIAKDLKHVLRAHATQEGSMTYSVHYSDVNGLSRLENYILGLEISSYMKAQNLSYRMSTSTLLHHADLARGFSISICPVPQQYLEPQQEPTNPLAHETTEGSSLAKIDSRYMRFTDHDVRSRIENGCDAVIKAEPTITRYDEIVGDGDCGYTLRDGAKQVLKFIANKDLSELPQTLGELVHDLEVNMGGTSGALYCIFLTAFSTTLANTDTIAGALAGALEQLMKYTRARLGDRTMLDCLIPFVETLQATGDVKRALQEAQKGVESTKNLEAKLGRSTYLDESATRGVPDPGAHGLFVLLSGMCAETQ